VRLLRWGARGRVGAIADSEDFELWRDELIHGPKTAENLLVRTEIALVRAGFELLSEPVACAFCGRPCRCRDPEGVVRHPRCPLTEEETSRLAEAKALQAQLRLEVERQRSVLEHLNRRSRKNQ
jgi:hypothetical protein